jgi:hemoglobin
VCPVTIEAFALEWCFATRDASTMFKARKRRNSAPVAEERPALEPGAEMLPDHLPSVHDDVRIVEDQITDIQARTLASIWRDTRDGESSALAALADTGEITRGAAPTLRRDLLALQRAASTESDQASPVTAQTQLAALLSYVVEHGPREPVPGWRNVPALDPHEESMLPWTDEHTTWNGTQPSRNGTPTPPPAISEHGHHEAAFDLIGGARAIEDLVETFYAMIMGDPQLVAYFKGFSVGKIKQHQHQFLTAVTGGPNIYVGRPLRVAHTALQISGPHFDRTADHLDAAMTVKGIDRDHRELVMARVFALRRHIVSE